MASRLAVVTIMLTKSCTIWCTIAAMLKCACSWCRHTTCCGVLQGCTSALRSTALLCWPTYVHPSTVQLRSALASLLPVLHISFLSRIGTAILSLQCATTARLLCCVPSRVLLKLCPIMLSTTGVAMLSDAQLLPVLKLQHLLSSRVTHIHHICLCVA